MWSNMINWRYRLTARTLPFQGENTGSTPVSATCWRIAADFFDSNAFAACLTIILEVGIVGQ